MLEVHFTVKNYVDKNIRFNENLYAALGWDSSIDSEEWQYQITHYPVAEALLKQSTQLTIPEHPAQHEQE